MLVKHLFGSPGIAKTTVRHKERRHKSGIGRTQSKLSLQSFYQTDGLARSAIEHVQLTEGHKCALIKDAGNLGQGALLLEPGKEDVLPKAQALGDHP